MNTRIHLFTLFLGSILWSNAFGQCNTIVEHEQMLFGNCSRDVMESLMVGARSSARAFCSQDRWIRRGLEEADYTFVYQKFGTTSQDSCTISGMIECDPASCENSTTGPPSGNRQDRYGHIRVEWDSSGVSGRFRVGAQNELRGCSAVTGYAWRVISRDNTICGQALARPLDHMDWPLSCDTDNTTDWASFRCMR